MNEPRDPPNREGRNEMERKIAARETRKVRARREKDRSIWFGLGMFGMIGWAVAIPTLIGVAIGLWIDATFPSRYSWTLMLLLFGVALGCLNAWHWVQKESRDGSDEVMNSDKP